MKGQPPTYLKWGQAPIYETKSDASPSLPAFQCGSEASDEGAERALQPPANWKRRATHRVALTIFRIVRPSR